MSFTIEVTGIEKMRALLDGLPDKLEAKGFEKLRVVLEAIRDSAKMFCPVDTGSLQASIRLEVGARPMGVIIRAGVRAGGYIVNPKTGKLVNYAAVVEFGSSRNRAQPYMRPALDQHQGELSQAIKEAVEESTK